MPPKIRKKAEGAGLNDPDQVMVGLQSTYGFLDKYKVHIVAGFVAVIVILLVVSGVTTYLKSSRESRAEAFFTAFKYAGAPVSEEMKSTAELPVFKTDKAKYEKLAEEMQGFLTENGDSEIGSTARLVLASSKMELGEYEGAYDLLNEFLAKVDNEALLPVVYENLGYACMHLGKTEEAVASFEKMKEASAEPYIMARALIHMGDLYNPGATSSAADKDSEKAREYYNAALEALPEDPEAEVNPQRFPVEEQTRRELKVRLSLLNRG